MRRQVSAPVLATLWSALAGVRPPAARWRADAAFLRCVRQGWIPQPRLTRFLADMDPRLGGVPLGDLLACFGLSLQHPPAPLWRRFLKSDRAVAAGPGMSVADMARLLRGLRRAGFTVDGGALLGVLDGAAGDGAPFPSAVRDDEPLLLECERAEGGPPRRPGSERCVTLLTATGFQVTARVGEDGGLRCLSISRPVMEAPFPPAREMMLTI